MANLLTPLMPIDPNPGLKDKVYEALKQAISKMDIYDGKDSPKLDERKLAQDLKVSRTPIREAITKLEQEGLVEVLPRRGAFVVRKSKHEIIEIIHIWAALESMAARLATQNATDNELSTLRKMQSKHNNRKKLKFDIDEYSQTNLAFHQTIVNLSQCQMLIDMAEPLFIHVKAIRRKTIAERDRAIKSIVDHMKIIEAIESRNANQAEKLVKEHALKLAEHVKKYVDYLPESEHEYPRKNGTDQ